jgi:hypothetical protein
MDIRSLFAIRKGSPAPLHALKINFLPKPSKLIGTRQIAGSRIKIFSDASETLVQRWFRETDFAKYGFQRT